ncbi:MAG: beta-propeller fold lactonase family protein [Terracidiphilus sp.]|jgi:6-phosphogluconolactonase (cycloisomerase 2 family)
MKSNRWLLAIFAAVATSFLTGCVPGAIDSSGQWGYLVDNNNGYELVVYQINPATGYPTVVQKYPGGGAVQPYTGASDQVVAVDPAGRFLYVYFTNNGASETIEQYSINQTTHALTLLSPSIKWTGTQPSVSSMTVDALGRFLFVSDSNSGVYSYSINPSTGLLTENGTTSFPTGGTGSSSAVADPTGRFLYSLLPSNAGVVTMAIQGNGSLAQVGSPLVIAGATGLGWISVDRTGAYLAIMGNNTIYTASVNRQTGALSNGGTVTGITSPTMPVFDPTNQFLYVGTNSGSQIETLTFNAATGALTPGPSVAANTNSSSFGDSQLLISGILQ